MHGKFGQQLGSVLSVSAVAERLGVTPPRVRAMIAEGILAASKVGGRWLVNVASVEKRQQASVLPGRMFSPGRAWGLLWLAAGERPDWLSPSDISHLRRRLREESLMKLAPRLRKRAVIHNLRGHPSDLPRIATEQPLVKTGVTVAHQFGGDLAPEANFLEAYIPESLLLYLKKKYALQSGPRHNLVLHAIDAPWPFDEHIASAPKAVVALDLLESEDARLRRAGAEMLGGHDD